MKHRKGRLWRMMGKYNGTDGDLLCGFFTMRSRRFFRGGSSFNTSVSVMYNRFFMEYSHKRMRRAWKRAYSCKNMFDWGSQGSRSWNGNDI